MTWSLRKSYALLAPVYDTVVERAFRQARIDSLDLLHRLDGNNVLINGIGTGLDLPYLPPTKSYVGLDITRAMLQRIPNSRAGMEIRLVEGDSLNLPFPDAAFDHVVLHLIVAVVPDSARCLREAARVAKPGGNLLLFDKFLRPTELAPLRRTINCIASRVATRTNVVFEQVLAGVPDVCVVSDEPALLGGWFRRIVLRKRA